MLKHSERFDRSNFDILHSTAKPVYILSLITNSRFSSILTCSSMVDHMKKDRASRERPGPLDLEFGGAAADAVPGPDDELRKGDVVLLGAVAHAQGHLPGLHLVFADDQHIGHLH